MKRRNTFTVAIAWAAAVTSLASVGQTHAAGKGGSTGPTTYYVSPSGSPKGSCTSTAPCKTLQYATSLAHPGDTVVVLAGTYGPQTMTANGTAAQPITVTAQGAVTLTRPANANSSVQNTPLLQIVNSSYVTVQGFSVQGMKGRSDLIPSATSTAIGEVFISDATVGAGAGLTVQNMTVTGSNLTCIRQQDSEQYQTFQNNTLTNCGAPGSQEEGIHLSGPNNTVTGNVISGVDGSGIVTYQNLLPVTNNVISGNTVSGAGTDGIYSYQGGGSITGNTLSGNHNGIEASADQGDQTIEGNVVSQNAWNGIVVHAGVSGQYTVDNNTFYQNGLHEVGFAGGNQVSGAVVNNIFSGNGDPALEGAVTGASPCDYNLYQNVSVPSNDGSNSMQADPMFKAPGHDFHLQSGSPAIGTADPVPLKLGFTAHDRGALQFSGA